MSHPSISPGPCRNSHTLAPQFAVTGHFSTFCGERCRSDPSLTHTEPSLHKYRRAIPAILSVLNTLGLVPSHT